MDIKTIFLYTILNVLYCNYTNKIGGIYYMSTKLWRPMSLLLLLAVVATGCGVQQETPGVESVQEDEVSTVVIDEEGKTDEELIEEYRGQLEAFSKFYEGTVTYNLNTIVPEDTLEESSPEEAMYEAYATKEGGNYHLPIIATDITFDGDLVQVQEKNLPQGNVFVEAKVILDGEFVYEDVDTFLTFAESMVEDNVLVNDVREYMFTEGYAERVADFKNKYTGYWVKGPTDIYTQSLDSVRAYYDGIHKLSTDDNTKVNREEGIITQTLTDDEVAGLWEAQNIGQPIFYDTMPQNVEDLTYDIHYDYVNKQFTIERTSPDGYGQTVTVNFKGLEDKLVLPEVDKVLDDYEKFYDAYTEMLGVREEITENEEMIEVEESAGDSVVGEEPVEGPVLVTGD